MDTAKSNKEFTENPIDEEKKNIIYNSIKTK